MTKKLKALLAVALVFSILGAAGGIFCDILWSSVLLDYDPNAPNQLGTGIGVVLSLVFSLPYAALFVVAIALTLWGLIATKKAIALPPDDPLALVSLKKAKNTYVVFLAINVFIFAVTLGLALWAYGLTQ